MKKDLLFETRKQAVRQAIAGWQGIEPMNDRFYQSFTSLIYGLTRRGVERIFEALAQEGVVSFCVAAPRREGETPKVCIDFGNENGKE